jgi:hypothetical protein
MVDIFRAKVWQLETQANDIRGLARAVVVCCMRLRMAMSSSLLTRWATRVAWGAPRRFSFGGQVVASKIPRPRGSGKNLPTYLPINLPVVIVDLESCLSA